MNKLMTVVAASVCAASFSASAFAGGARDPEPTQNAAEATASEAVEAEGGEEEAAGLVEQMHEIFEAGFDVDFFSAYVWRNSVLNDEPVIQPCAWMDFTYFKPFWLGFYCWQNYDLTSRRHECLRGGLTETDWEVHLGATAWESEDESTYLDLEIGHDWFVNRGVKSESRESYKNTAEVYAKATFNNDYVNVYGLTSWMYDDFGDFKQGFHYELGLNRELDVATLVDIPEEKLILGLDWNVNFGDSRYLYFLYGGVDYREGPDGEETCSNPTAGIGGTTVKAYFTWNITEWMSFGCTLAYTGVLNGSARQALGDEDTGWQGDPYRRDLLWGGCSLKFKF